MMKMGWAAGSHISDKGAMLIGSEQSFTYYYFFSERKPITLQLPGGTVNNLFLPLH